MRTFRTHLKLLKSKLRSSSGIQERRTSYSNEHTTSTNLFEPTKVTAGRITHRLVTPVSQSSTKSWRSSTLIESHKQNHSNTAGKLQAIAPSIAEAIFDEQSSLVSARRQETSKVETPENERLLKCDMCNRTFREDIIEKHSLVCLKVQNANRPKFDSKSHRLAGIQTGGKPVQSAFAASSNSKANIQTKPSTDDRIAIKRPSWRDKSDQLRAAIGAARSNDPREKLRYEQELARVNQQCLTKCEFCGRSFNADAAARHIPICQNKAQMMPRKLARGPIDKTVSEVTSRVLANSGAVSRVPLTSTNRVSMEPRKPEQHRRGRNRE